MSVSALTFSYVYLDSVSSSVTFITSLHAADMNVK